ncbi:hypothetical protein OsJ_02882 [Oryza sativa Japonica Group]|uniref:DUF7769 domain-containing protein n=1 Tax=Oryza sativa subsp. japonica TaxID=39947 RepID=A2ZW65_ORYSJ|nr:hypothetical protein OsJ_02882 [Oryza sativa Japonica Group]
MIRDLNLLLEEEGEEGDQGALPDLNEEIDMEEDGRHVVILGDNLLGVDGQEHGGFLDLNLHPFDLNMVATEEEEMQQDDHEALQFELEALENDLQDYGVYAEAVNVVFDVEELPDSDDDQEEHANENVASKSKDLTNIQRRGIYQLLLQKSKDGKLEKHTTRLVAQEFHVSIHTVQRIWKRAKICHEQGIAVNVDSRKHGNSGRKKVEIDLSVIAAIPLHQRRNIRSLAQALGVPKSTLHRWFKEGLIRRHSNSLKPYLKEANKKERLQWCVSMLDPHTLPNNPKFIEMENIIHIDEKWFNASKKEKTFYLYPDEEEPYFTVHNKNAIDKVMFLSAVAKPRYDDEGNCTFDGKIGIWPFTRKVKYPSYYKCC